jgi:hypothetical protein
MRNETKYTEMRNETQRNEIPNKYVNVKTVNKCKHVHGAMEMHFMKHTSYSFNITSKNTTVIPT